jgi:hypothetical protein
LGQLNLAAGWDAFRDTPDYCKTCAAGTAVGVPLSHAAHQMPCDGSGFAGILMWCAGLADVRELQIAELIEPLSIRAPVSIRFRMVSATGGTGG